MIMHDNDGLYLINHFAKLTGNGLSRIEAGACGAAFQPSSHPVYLIVLNNLIHPSVPLFQSSSVAVSQAMQKFAGHSKYGQAQQQNGRPRCIENWALQCGWARSPLRSNSNPIRTDDGTGKSKRAKRHEEEGSSDCGVLGSAMGKKRQLICLAAAVAAAAILLTGNERSLPPISIASSESSALQSFRLPWMCFEILACDLSAASAKKSGDVTELQIGVKVCAL